MRGRVKLAADGLLDTGRAAMHGMQRRCAELHISDVGMRAKLFKTLVQPVLTYACEVWAVQLIKYDKAGQPVTSMHEHHSDIVFKALVCRAAQQTALFLQNLGSTPYDLCGCS